MTDSCKETVDQAKLVGITSSDELIEIGTNVTRALSNGVKLQEDYFIDHMVNANFVRSKGIVGGHNWDKTSTYLNSIGEQINITSTTQSGFNGVYEIKY